MIIGNAYRGGQGLESHWKVVVNQEPAFSYRKIVKGKKDNIREAHAYLHRH
ncbi:MAG: DUF4886 domain-containing protein [Hoylesella buccalis]